MTDSTQPLDPVSIDSYVDKMERGTLITARDDATEDEWHCSLCVEKYGAGNATALNCFTKFCTHCYYGLSPTFYDFLTESELKTKVLTGAERKRVLCSELLKQHQQMFNADRRDNFAKKNVVAMAMKECPDFMKEPKLSEKPSSSMKTSKTSLTPSKTTLQTQENLDLNVSLSGKIRLSVPSRTLQSPNVGSEAVSLPLQQSRQTLAPVARSTISSNKTTKSKQPQTSMHSAAPTSINFPPTVGTVSIDHTRNSCSSDSIPSHNGKELHVCFRITKLYISALGNALSADRLGNVLFSSVGTVSQGEFVLSFIIASFSRVSKHLPLS
jgi:hypothetical protein